MYLSYFIVFDNWYLCIYVHAPALHYYTINSVIKIIFKFLTSAEQISYIRTTFCRRWAIKSCFYSLRLLIFTIAHAPLTNGKIWFVL